MSTPTDEAPPGDSIEPPWGASVVGVRNLAIDVAAEGRRPGQLAPRVSDATVSQWVEAAAAYIGARTVVVEQLPEAASAPPGVLTREDACRLRRHLVELHAAALLLDITHPQGLNGRPAGEPLRSTFRAELTDLRDDALAAGVLLANDRDRNTPGVQGDGAAYRMPPARVTSSMGF